MSDLPIQRHGVAQSIALHLLPGLPPVVLFWATVDAITAAGLPKAFAWGVLANVGALLPIQLGVLYAVARRRGARGLSLQGVIAYRSRLSWTRCAGLVLAILAATAAIFAGLEGVAGVLRPVFADWPIDVAGGYEGTFSRPAFFATAALNIALTAVVVPFVEELYFRGYLLPRMPVAFGRAGPVVHSFLFAVYHIAEPWMIPVRTLGLLPLIFATRYARSIVPAVLSHMLVNAQGAIASVLSES